MGLASHSLRAASGLSGVAIALMFVAGTACVVDPCNGECADGFVCDESLLACVPVKSDPPDGGGCETQADCTSGLAPVCDEESGRCVECRTGDDCRTGRCDAASRICLPPGCQRQQDCAGEIGTPYCSSDGSCVECRASPDCPMRNGKRRVCDLGLRECVESPCRTDGDCARDPAGGRVCETDKGICVDCVGDQDCGSGRCLVELNRCVSCLSDDDCDPSMGETCVQGTFRCQVTGCGSDAQCPAPLRCDPQTRACEFCLGDDDCIFGGICSGSECVDPPACEGDGDCLWPRLCEGGACVACRNADQCGEGRACVEGACVEPETCEHPAECDAGRSCTEGVCAPVFCPLDAYEPNDTVGQARPMPVGRFTAVLCPNALDHYALSVPDGAGVEVKLTHDASLPSPTLELIRPTPQGPTVVATATGRNAGARRIVLEKVADGPTTFVARISGADGRAVTYSLEARVVPGGLCANDDREPDDTPSQATSVAPGVHDGVLCHSDHDWVAVDVPEGLRPVVRLEVPASPSAMGVTVTIYRNIDGVLQQEAFAGLKIPADESEWSGVATTAAPTVAPPEGARYWIAVRNLTARKFEYDLRIDLRPRPPENDGCIDPPTLTPGVTAEGSLLGASDHLSSGCSPEGSVEVYWSLELAEPSAVRLAVDAEFPVALSLRDACEGGEIACVQSARFVDALELEGLAAGRYVVQLEASGGEQGRYSLLAQLEPAAAAPGGVSCEAPAPLDFDQGVASAHGNLALATDAVESSCGLAGNDAVYAIELLEPKHLVAELAAFEGASLTLVAAADCGQASAGWCAPISSAGAGSRIERLALEAGLWLLIIDGGSVVRGSFDLQLQLSAPVYPPVNDSCDDAVELDGPVAGDTRAATNLFAPVCGASRGVSGDVVYRLVVAEEQAVKLSLAAAFDATLTLTQAPCESGAVLACGDGFDVSLSFAALDPGEYFVRVDGYRDDAGPFLLDVERSPAEPLPGNDTCENPQLVVVDGVTALAGSTARANNDMQPATCTGHPLEGPDVAYAVEVPPGATLTAELLPEGFDGALVVLDDCAAAVCLAGADDSLLVGGAERLSLRNDGEEAVIWRVVVDSWREGEGGAFTLLLSLD